MQADDVFRQQLLGVIPRLRRYARSLVFDASAADDLVQTTLERALAHWHQFDQRRDLLVWVLSIAHNAHLDQRRRDARLSPEQREPLLLVSVEQLTYAECAEVLRIPVGTVMSRVSRARAVLRQFLDGSVRPAAGGHLRRVI